MFQETVPKTLARSAQLQRSPTLHRPRKGHGLSLPALFGQSLRASRSCCCYALMCYPVSRQPSANRSKIPLLPICRKGYRLSSRSLCSPVADLIVVGEAKGRTPRSSRVPSPESGSIMPSTCSYSSRSRQSDCRRIGIFRPKLFRSPPLPHMAKGGTPQVYQLVGVPHPSRSPFSFGSDFFGGFSRENKKGSFGTQVPKHYLLLC